MEAQTAWRRREISLPFRSKVRCAVNDVAANCDGPAYPFFGTHSLHADGGRLTPTRDWRSYVSGRPPHSAVHGRLVSCAWESTVRKEKNADQTTYDASADRSGGGRARNDSLRGGAGRRAERRNFHD